jgi:transcriptional regulator with XRE-family HTH domain
MEQPKNKDQTNNHAPITLSALIRDARVHRHMSARRLSEALHMHTSYISRLENSISKHPSPEKLRRIAEYLELNYNDLCALAGYQAPGLPAFLPYLRAKYVMSDDDVERLSKHFESLRAEHGIVEKQPPRDRDDQDDMKGFVSWKDL